MNIIWQYLDKRGAAINALKDYSSMAYIIEHTDEEIANIHDDMVSISSPEFTDIPHDSFNPQSGEIRLTSAIDEIDVLRERYRQAKEYMEWFQPAWDALSEICDKYSIERTSAYKKKNRAVAKLALLLFGK